MSVAAAAMSALVGTNNVLAPLLPSPTVITYSAPRDMGREQVYGGSITGPVTLLAMAGGARIQRREDLTLRLVVRVYQPGEATRESTDARAVAIGDVIANYIAANKTLGGITELRLAQVTEVDLDGWSDDDGSGSVLVISVGLLSHLS